MSERVVGYCFLIIGVLVMIFSVYYLFLVFTNKATPLKAFHPDPFSNQQQTYNPQDLLTNPSAVTQMQTALITQVLEKQMDKTWDTAATGFLMYFIMLLGFRLSTLGVQLIRPIQVKLRTKEVEVDKTPVQ